MKKTLWTLASMAALVVALATCAHAIPSLAGPTGIVSVPNTAITPQTELQLALGYQPFEMYADNDATAWALQAVSGVSENAELWAAYSRIHDGADTDIWQIGGKQRLRGDWPGDMEVAFGGSIGRWTHAFGMPWTGSMGMYDADFIKLYAVASREMSRSAAAGWRRGPLPTRIIADAGLLYISIDSDAGGSESTLRPFLALEIIQGTSVWGIEYRSRDRDVDEKGVFSALLRRPVGRDTYLEIGTTNASPIGLGLEDQDFFVRVGIDFPLEQRVY